MTDKHSMTEDEYRKAYEGDWSSLSAKCPGCKKTGSRKQMHEWEQNTFWHGGCIEEKLAWDAREREGFQAMEAEHNINKRLSHMNYGQDTDL